MNVYPGMIPELDITLDTPEWFDWLSSANQFKYVGNLTEMSVKRRASNGKWYARKKVYSSNGGSKPVDLYIGSDSECTAEKLREINFHFAKDWVAFWQWYHSPSRKQGKGKGVQTSEVYTEEVTTSQTQEEITELKARIEELEAKLRSTEARLEKEASDAQRYYPGWRKLPGLESELRFNKHERQKLEQSVSELQTANASLGKQLSECSRHQPTALDLLNEFLRGESIPLDEKGKPKARYDQLAKFKTWLESQSGK